jgi:hypothetical protein
MTDIDRNLFYSFNKKNYEMRTVYYPVTMQYDFNCLDDIISKWLNSACPSLGVRVQVVREERHSLLWWPASTQAWNPVWRVWCSIQPMPQYELLFHSKIMANGINLASEKKLKTIGKDFNSLNVIISPKPREAPGSFATNWFPMLWWKLCTVEDSEGVMFVRNLDARQPFKLEIVV